MDARRPRRPSPVTRSRRRVCEAARPVLPDGRRTPVVPGSWLFTVRGGPRASPSTGSPNRVRVAHLDTGYDPGHESVPTGLNRALQKNFVDADRPDDATDDSGGLLNNLGHGTGTLGILAGASVGSFTKAYGAAPFVEVIPVRVANSVLIFQNSSIAKGLDYVHSFCQREETRVHVVTMSMGGLASSAWADAINALYDAGVFVLTAAGNNFGNLPTRNIVYPACFNRERHRTTDCRERMG